MRRLRGFVAILSVLVGWGLAARAENAERLPASWYLEITSERSDRIRAVLEDQTFANLRLPLGLYVQDARDVWGRADLKPGQLVAEVSFELPGFPGLSHMGFASAKPEDLQDLWLVLPNNQRFKLSSLDPKTGDWSSAQFLPPPETKNHWLPVKGGAVWFNENWFAFHQYQDAEKRKAQNPTTEGVPLMVSLLDENVKVRVQPRVFAKDLGNGKQPLISYNGVENRLLVITHPLSAAQIPPQENGSGKDPKTFDLAIVDLPTAKGTQLATGIKWPFSFSNRGVYYQDERELYFIEVDWVNLKVIPDPKTHRAARKIRDLKPNQQIESYGYNFFILEPNAQNTKKLRYTLNTENVPVRYVPETARFSPIDLAEDEAMATFEQDGTIRRKIDILEDLKMGAKSPRYSVPSVNTQLARALGASNKTWAIVVYDEGQMPDDIVADFVWKLVNESLAATSELVQLDRVYHIPGSAFDLADVNDSDFRFQTLAGVVNGRRALTYLSDFPAELLSQVRGGAPGERVNQFWNHFKEGILNGTSRVMMSMKSSIYEDLWKNYPDILRNAQVIRVPAFTPAEAQSVIGVAKGNLERRRNKRFTQEGEKMFFDYLGSGANKSDTKSPGKEFEFLTEFFDYLETNQPRTNDLDRAVVQGWMDQRNGSDVFRRTIDPEKACRELRERVVSHDEPIDRICTVLKAVKQGVRLSKKGPLAKFVFTGPTGTGKTFIPEQLADVLYHEPPFLVDVSGLGTITKNSPLYIHMNTNPEKIKIILFDDIHQIQDERKLMDKLAGVMENGIFGENTDVEMDFRNSIVFWTANWAEKIINKAVVNGPSLREQVQQYLTEERGDAPPILEERNWGRIQSGFYIFHPFTQPQLLELALVLARVKLRELDKLNYKQVKIDPHLLMEITAREKKVQAGARTIVDLLANEIFGSDKAQQYIVDKQVHQFVIRQSVNPVDRFDIITNLMPSFKAAWNDPKIPDILAWTEKEDQKYVCKYFEEYGALQEDVSRVQFEDYKQKYCGEGK